MFTKASLLEGPGRQVVHSLKRDSILRQAEALYDPRNMPYAVTAVDSTRSISAAASPPAAPRAQVTCSCTRAKRP